MKSINFDLITLDILALRSDAGQKMDEINEFNEYRYMAENENIIMVPRHMAYQEGMTLDTMRYIYKYLSLLGKSKDLKQAKILDDICQVSGMFTIPNIKYPEIYENPVKNFEMIKVYEYLLRQIHNDYSGKYIQERPEIDPEFVTLPCKASEMAERLGLTLNKLRVYIDDLIENGYIEFIKQIEDYHRLYLVRITDEVA